MQFTMFRNTVPEIIVASIVRADEQKTEQRRRQRHQTTDRNQSIGLHPAHLFRLMRASEGRMAPVPTVQGSSLIRRILARISNGAYEHIHTNECMPATVAHSDTRLLGFTQSSV